MKIVWRCAEHEQGMLVEGSYLPDDGSGRKFVAAGVISDGDFTAEALQTVLNQAVETITDLVKETV